MASEPTGEELRAIQDEILGIVHQLDRIVTHLRRLLEGIVVVDDEAMIEGDEPPSLGFEIRGVLDLTGDQIAEAARLLRRAGVETEETLRREYQRLDKPRAGMPATGTAAIERRAGGNGSPNDPEG